MNFKTHTLELWWKRSDHISHQHTPGLPRPTCPRLRSPPLLQHCRAAPFTWPEPVCSGTQSDFFA